MSDSATCTICNGSGPDWILPPERFVHLACQQSGWRRFIWFLPGRSVKAGEGQNCIHCHLPIDPLKEETIVLEKSKHSPNAERRDLAHQKCPDVPR
jgi:hypothetical protein